MQIGITDTLSEDNYEHYVDWIRSVDGSVDIQKLSHKLDNESDIEKLDGLLLSGGGDVHPRYFAKESRIMQSQGVDEQRDEFEFALIEKALDAEIPILGVCRGMQVMNVCLGGSLVTNLISEGYNDHTSPNDGMTMHGLSVLPHSMLHALTNTNEIEVNSFHHQGVNRLGKGLIATAISSDNIIEAAEWAVKDTMPFLILVQWHPERLAGTFLSQKLARVFLREVYQFQLNKRRTIITN